MSDPYFLSIGSRVSGTRRFARAKTKLARSICRAPHPARRRYTCVFLFLTELSRSRPLHCKCKSGNNVCIYRVTYVISLSRVLITFDHIAFAESQYRRDTCIYTCASAHTYTYTRKMLNLILRCIGIIFLLIPFLRCSC